MVHRYFGMKDGQSVLHEGHPVMLALGKEGNPIQVEAKGEPSNFHIKLKAREPVAVDILGRIGSRY